jgi:hypothetical protein
MESQVRVNTSTNIARPMPKGTQWAKNSARVWRLPIIRFRPETTCQTTELLNRIPKKAPLVNPKEKTPPMSHRGSGQVHTTGIRAPKKVAMLNSANKKELYSRIMMSKAQAPTMLPKMTSVRMRKMVGPSKKGIFPKN